MKIQIGTVGARCGAMHIAKYIIDRQYCHATPVSNLQLQRILYLLQLMYATETGNLLFDDSFEAWAYGPIVHDVYVEFSNWGGFPIKQKFDIEIEGPLSPFINAGIDMLAIESPWSLVRVARAEGSPWDVVYNQKNMPRGIIPNGLIMQFVVDTLHG